MKTVIIKAAEVLNGLLQINNDRVEGYQKAAEETPELDLKTVFKSMADESKKNASELIREIKNQVVIRPADEKTTFTGKGPSCNSGLLRIWKRCTISLSRCHFVQ